MKKKGFTLIELMIVVAIIGILAMIAIPNFIKFQCRAKQSEAKSNLKAMFQAQKSWFAEYDEYSTLKKIGFDPEPGNRYTYCNAPGDCRMCENGRDSGFVKNMCNGTGEQEMECTTAAGRTGENSPDDKFTSCATGNIDNSADFDSWRINDANRLVNDDNDCA
jgi:type IV pilus assembly protein PilA